LSQMLDFCGVERDRLRARWVSSAEAPEFVEEVNSFVDALKLLGPSPLKIKMEAKITGKIKTAQTAETAKIGVS
jgi:Methyl-viologen-reducing hydrogenase, delta subunit